MYPELPVFFRIGKNNKCVCWKGIKLIFFVCFQTKITIFGLFVQRKAAPPAKLQEDEGSSGDTGRPNVLAVQPLKAQADSGRQSWIFYQLPQLWAVVFRALQVCYFPDPRCHAECTLCSLHYPTWRYLWDDALLVSSTAPAQSPS